MNFSDVVNLGNITKLAKLLYMSQQNLSTSIKRLKDELQMPPFERSQNKLTLTPRWAI